MNPLTIHGLTAEQVELLEILWQFEELEDVEAWKEEQDPETQQQVELLIRMVILAMTDDFMAEDTSQAKEYLKRFRL